MPIANEGSSKLDHVTIMTTTNGIILTVYWYLTLTLAKPQNQAALNDFWQNVQPGELLRSLDQLTSSSHVRTEQLPLKERIAEHSLDQQTQENTLQRRADEGSEESLEHREPYDYDKAYEEFVKKYFDDSVTDAFSASVSKENKENEAHEAESYSGEESDISVEDEPIIEASTKTKSKEKCRKVVKAKQNCLICKNPRNGETSERCSYNEETKPTNFAFEKQQNFHKYRSKPRESGENNSNEDTSAAQTKASIKQLKLTPSKLSNATYNCTMKRMHNKTCYYCENKKGERITKCYNEEIPDDNDNDKSKNKTRKLQKSHQRIYKRTLSYTYENTPHADIKFNGTVILEKPLVEKSFLLKELNENER